jgi:tetratricopeptide (TPR) repeat protein
MTATLARALLAGVVATATGDDRPYRGKYADDKEFQEVLARVAAAKRAALVNVEKTLGLAPRAPDRIDVEVVDAIGAKPERLAKFTRASAETSTNDARIVIRLHAEFLASGAIELEETLRHEMVHAVMRERMDRAAYAAVPTWLREGLALFAARQGPERVAFLLSSRAALAGVEPLLPGLGVGDHDLDRYAEDFLAVDYVERRGGAGAAAKLARALVDGKSCAAALQATVGIDEAAFRGAARADALERAPKFEPPGWKDYGDLSKLDEARRYAEVVAAAERFEAALPDARLLGDVLYFRGKAERLLGKHGDAVATLERLLAIEVKRRSSTHYLDEALYQFGRSALESKQHEKAATAFERIVRDVPDSSLQETALFHQAKALAGAKRDAPALECLDLFDRSFPASKLAGEAKELRRTIASRR